jgi:hypothetical protein
LNPDQLVSSSPWSCHVFLIAVGLGAPVWSQL